MRARTCAIRAGALLLLALLAVIQPAASEEIDVAANVAGDLETPSWWPIPVILRDPPFDSASPLHRFDYLPRKRTDATSAARLCLAVPMARFQVIADVIRGVEYEAARQGAVVEVLNAEGEDLGTQREQLRTCLETSDAIIIVPVTASGFGGVFRAAAAKDIPVVNVGIETVSQPLTARIVPDAFLIGAALGRYVADLYPAGGDEGRVLWFPGPEQSGFARDYDAGFRHAIEHSAAEIVGGGFTALDAPALQAALNEALSGAGDISAIAGVGLMIQVAIDQLAGRPDAPLLLSTSVTDKIAGGVADGTVAGAVDTRPVALGLLAADIALRAVDGEAHVRDVQPGLSLVDEANVAAFDPDLGVVPDP